VEQLEEAAKKHEQEKEQWQKEKEGLLKMIKDAQGSENSELDALFEKCKDSKAKRAYRRRSVNLIRKVSFFENWHAQNSSEVDLIVPHEGKRKKKEKYDREGSRTKKQD